jgi:hypothetical protein
LEDPPKKSAEDKNFRTRVLSRSSYPMRKSHPPRRAAVVTVVTVDVKATGEIALMSKQLISKVSLQTQHSLSAPPP